MIKAASEMSAVLDELLFAPLTHLISDAVPWPFVNEMLVGVYGILTMGVFNAFGTVLPILITFFLIIHFLEDVGYLPNLSVLVNRTLAPFGMTGKAVLPLILGTGCNTMATLTTRILSSRKERIMAIFLIALGIPCAVQLGVMLAILATAPFSALLIVIGTVLATQIICGLALSCILPVGDSSSGFMLELPTFRWPDSNNIVRKTYFRVKWFLAEALPMFVFASVMMFTLEKTGLLIKIKQFLHPVITGFLSLPDKTTEVFILVLSRREVGAIYFKDMVDAGGLETIQVVVGLVVMTLFMPCIENSVMMARELGVRWAVGLNLVIVFIAISVGGLVNYLVRLF